MSPFIEYPSRENNHSTTSIDPQATIHNELGRLIHAAIINKHFCEMLLSNPVQSIERGYQGETFQFNKEIKERILGIKASTLEEFSSELLRITSTPVVREVAVAHFR